MTTETVGFDTKGDREALERLIGDDDLHSLESHIVRFNIFDALGIARAEIRHSNFLAFILDPAESHGQGQLFLKAVLIDLFKTAPEPFRSRLPLELDGMDLRSVDVRREWENIDLLIVCRQPALAVVIENKVDSQEHSDQLSRYQRVIQARYPDLPALYVYLTPDGDKPSKDSWEPYTYADVYRVLRHIMDLNPTLIPADVVVFLDHYLNLLRTRFMNDETLDEFCQRIYKKHRRALDSIWERVGSLKSAFFIEVMNVFKNDPRWHVFHKEDTFIQFVPRTWLDWLPPFGIYDESPKYWIIAQLRADKGRVSFNVYVGSMRAEDLHKQSAIITKLREVSQACGFKSSRAWKVDGKWNQIFADDNVSEWREHEEPESDVIRQQVKEKLNDL